MTTLRHGDLTATTSLKGQQQALLIVSSTTHTPANIRIQTTVNRESVSIPATGRLVITHVNNFWTASAETLSCRVSWTLPESSLSHVQLLNGSYGSTAESCDAHNNEFSCSTVTWRSPTACTERTPCCGAGTPVTESRNNAFSTKGVHCSDVFLARR
jgi:hypothetical protein